MIFVNNLKNKIEDLERFEMQQAGMKGLKSLKSWSPQDTEAKHENFRIASDTVKEGQVG